MSAVARLMPSPPARVERRKEKRGELGWLKRLEEGGREGGRVEVWVGMSSDQEEGGREGGREGGMAARTSTALSRSSPFVDPSMRQ